MTKKILNFISLIIIDIMALLFSTFIAYWLRIFVGDIFGISSFDISVFQHLYWFLFLYIIIFAMEGFYTERKPFWEQTREFIKILTIIILFMFAIFSFLKMPYNFSRAYIILFWAISLFIVPIFRFYGKRFLYKLGIWREPIIIIGINKESLNTADELFNNLYIGYNIVGFVSFKNLHDTNKLINDKYKILGDYKDLKKIATQYNVSVILIGLFDIENFKLSDIIRETQLNFRRILLLPQKNSILLQNTQLLPLFSKQSFLFEINNNLKKEINSIIKIIFDYTIAFLLFPILVPILIILALLIKLDSRGSIFFRHERVGKNGKKIKVIKFRSMHIDAKQRLEYILQNDEKLKKEWEQSFKLKNDPRITKIGSLLRKTSLDELPQFFNVLLGNMSFVGPRPVIEDEIIKYYKEDAKYYYMVRPGITGLWQVSGRSDTDYDFRIKTDKWYVLNWSIWMDIIILLKTVKVVLKREGAY